MRAWIAWGLLVGSAATCAASDPSATTPPLETVLDNGVRVVLQERPEVPMVAATAIVGAGSALEDEAFSGASHFLEHLLFNGTSTMTQAELYDAVDRIGGYSNAHTDEDHTYFTMLVPSEHASTGLEIQAAMLFDSTLPADKFDKERGIILEELARDRSRPGHDADVAVRAALWAETPYARPVIGTYDSLAGIEPDRVRAYWRRRYVPGNVLLWVVGDFDRAAMLESIRATYGAMDRAGGPPDLPDPFAGLDGAAITRVAVDDPTPRVAIAVPAPGPCDPGGPAAELLAEALGATGGPLRNAVAADVAPGLSAGRIARPSGSALVVRAELAEGADPESVADALLAALRKVGRDGLGAPGLDRSTLERLARAARAGDALAGQRIHYVGMLRADAVAACEGSVVPVVAPETVPAPSPDDVARIAADILGTIESSARVVVAGPDVDPSGPVALELAPLPPADPRGAASPTVEGADLDRTLASGLRVIVAREPAARVTGIHVLVRDRSAREPDGLAGIADVVHRLLPYGTGLSSRTQIASRLERIGADLKTADSDFIPYDDYYTDGTHAYIRLETPSDGWLAALDLLAELVRIPALEDDDLAAVLPSRATRAGQVAVSPATVGSREFARAMLGEGHPETRPVGGSPETLAGVDKPTIREFQRRFHAPEALIVSVVGPHDPEDVAGAVEERFPVEPSGVDRTATPPWPLTGEPGEPTTIDVGADQSRVYLGRIAHVPPGDRAGLRVLAAILTDRLGRSVRETLGLAYSVGAGVDFQAAPDRGWMSVRIGTRPGNVGEAIDAIRTEMNRLRESMATVDEIDRIRAVRRGRSLMRRMAAINRARLLGLRAFTGVPAAEDLDALAEDADVSRAQLERLAIEWLDPDRYRVVIAR